MAREEPPLAATKPPLWSADDPSNGTPILLTLPVTDFPTAKSLAVSQSTAISRVGNSVATPSDAGYDNNDDSDQFVLLQLPPAKKDSRGDGYRSISISDLISGGASIVGPSGANEDRGESGGRHACFVLEGKGASFSLNRVETSNALVLVPPQSASMVTAVAAAWTDSTVEGAAERDGPPPSKRLKRQQDGRPAEMRARLLNLGGSGASFLEVRPRRLDRSALRSLLASAKYDPSCASDLQSKRGIAVPELVSFLQCSETEVRWALLALGAFEMAPAGSERYGMLAEEAQTDATTAIVEALNECEEYADLFPSEGGSGNRDMAGTIYEEDFVNRVVDRSRQYGADVLEESVVRHCLRLCAVEENTVVGGRYKISLDKIAIFLGHHLFNQQSEPWKEDTFLIEWHKLIPGICNASRPDVQLLIRAGVALHTSKPKNTVNDRYDESKMKETVYLKYFPESKLPMEQEGRFRRIFLERERWSKEDLQPYIKNLAEEHGATTAELLLKHTRTVIGEGGEQLYVAR